MLRLRLRPRPRRRLLPYPRGRVRGPDRARTAPARRPSSGSSWAWPRPPPGSIEVLGAPPTRPSSPWATSPRTPPTTPPSRSPWPRWCAWAACGAAAAATARRTAGPRTPALEQADVAELRDRPYSALSGGQRRRVLVARALAAEPRLLVLDEPTANMDAESETRLFRALGELKGKATVLVVTHDTLFVSDLTDAVLCVGERDGRPGSVVRHASVPGGRGAWRPGLRRRRPAGPPRYGDPARGPAARKGAR
ncbi:MAG: ATP-binding cassette domain-containing protein [Ignavibacteriales bacterium]|nr:ATP-binding cassette domain-containing protein [Ignavibacteriales bacterium]